MVSIITINYNGWQDTCDLIASLKRYETEAYEIIVVDNASSGDDVKQIRQRYPEVTLLESSMNLGFAGGNNWGYQYANGDCLLFLNNDMEIKAPFLRPLVARLECSHVGGVSPCIRYFHRPDKLQYYGYSDMTTVTLKHTTLPLDYGRLEDYLKPSETEILHGGAMMVRRDVIERVGLMTEVYFLFYEEFDWSLRMRKAGYQLFYEPSSVVYHKESMSIPKATPLREYYLIRSRMIYARRNIDGWKQVVACAYILCMAMPKRVLEFMFKGRKDLANAVWKGVFSGLWARRE